MCRHPQLFARDAEARHHVVEAPQVFHETTVWVTHVSVRPLRDPLRNLQRFDALWRIQRHEAWSTALGTLLDPAVFVGLPLPDGQACCGEPHHTTTTAPLPRPPHGRGRRPRAPKPGLLPLPPKTRSRGVGFKGRKEKEKERKRAGAA